MPHQRTIPAASGTTTVSIKRIEINNHGSMCDWKIMPGNDIGTVLSSARFIVLLFSVYFHQHLFPLLLTSVSSSIVSSKTHISIVKREQRQQHLFNGYSYARSLARATVLQNWFWKRDLMCYTVNCDHIISWPLRRGEDCKLSRLVFYVLNIGTCTGTVTIARLSSNACSF